MARSKPFTDRYLANLRPRESRYDVLDGSRKGLMLRVTAAGTKTFFFRYQRQGKTERLMIGHYPAKTLREAYEKHGELETRLHRGEFPLTGAEPDDSSEGSATRSASVKELAEEFLHRYIYVERKQPRDAELIIKGNILKYWSDRPACEISRRDAVLLLDKIVDRGAPVMANRVAALLSQMFRFGVERGIPEASPLIALPRPGGSEPSRSRQLDEREIRLFWQRLRSPKSTPPIRLALKLILVTAQRPGEVAFIIPTRCWRKRGTAAITVRAVSQAVRDNRLFGIPDFTPHDLRRTAASRMTSLGVPRLHVEKILNHTLSDVAEIYDRHDYSMEKRAAIEK